MVIVLAVLIGVIAGLRSLAAPAIVSWAARLGWLHVDGSWLAFLGYRWTPWIFSIAAVGELVNDKLPKTPSRKTAPQFIFRVITGAVSGAAFGMSTGDVWACLAAGAVGAVAGTLGGAAARSALAQAIGKDWPVALLEDAVAIGGGLLIVRQLL
ncbi:MAG TPA: DUF4126 family protein [Silvibacterium sp.]|nr:DUF4126 family protein [Silvibacterium sp.]